MIRIIIAIIELALAGNNIAIAFNYYDDGNALAASFFGIGAGVLYKAACNITDPLIKEKKCSNQEPKSK